jgi:hypothetical protein
VIPARHYYDGYKGDVRNRGEAESQVYQAATARVFSLVGEQAANKTARIARHLGGGA